MKEAADSTDPTQPQPQRIFPTEDELVALQMKLLDMLSNDIQNTLANLDEEDLALLFPNQPI